MNWVKAHSEKLPAAPVPDEGSLEVVEMDELHTFVSQKKQVVHNDFG